MTFHGSLFNVRVSYSMRCLYSVWPVLKCLPNSVSPSSCSTQSFPVIFFYSVVVFLYRPMDFAPCIHSYILDQRLRRTICRILEFCFVLLCSFSAQLPSLLSCLTISSQSYGICLLSPASPWHFGFPPPALFFAEYLRKENWCNRGAHLMSLILRDHRFVLPVILK